MRKIFISRKRWYYVEKDKLTTGLKKVKRMKGNLKFWKAALNSVLEELHSRLNAVSLIP